jgi:hypothetical protein
MFDAPLVAFLTFLFTIQASAQVNAPPCTNSSLAWVSYPWLVAAFVIINIPIPLTFMTSHSTRSGRVHVKSRRTYLRNVTMAVSRLLY